VAGISSSCSRHVAPPDPPSFHILCFPLAVYALVSDDLLDGGAARYSTATGSSRSGSDPRLSGRADDLPDGAGVRTLAIFCHPSAACGSRAPGSFNISSSGRVTSASHHRSVDARDDVSGLLLPLSLFLIIWRCTTAAMDATASSWS